MGYITIGDCAAIFQGCNLGNTCRVVVDKG